MDNLYERVDEILERAPEARPSYFQLKYFVLGKQPTIQSQFWACMRELKTRKEKVESINLEIEEMQDQLELLGIQEKRQAEEQEFGTDLERHEAKIKLRILNRKRKAINNTLDNLENQLKFTEQEINFIVQYFDALLKVEPLKDYDDLEVQTEYWNEKLTEEINLRILLKQPINIELAKEILSLNDDTPIKLELINFLEKQKQPDMDLLLEQMKEKS